MNRGLRFIVLCLILLAGNLDASGSSFEITENEWREKEKIFFKNRPKLDVEDTASILGFISYYSCNHYLFKRKDLKESREKFYKNPTFFDIYLQDYFLSIGTEARDLKKVWYFYHIKGARFFLSQLKFMLAQEAYVQAFEIQFLYIKEELNSATSILKNKLKRSNFSEPRAIIQEFVTMSENILKSFSLEEFDISRYLNFLKLHDAINDHKFVVFLGELILKKASSEIEEGMTIDTSKIKKRMAINSFELKKYDQAEKYYEGLNLDEYDLKVLLVIAATRKDWQQSYTCLKDLMVLIEFENQLKKNHPPFRFSKEEQEIFKEIMNYHLTDIFEKEIVIFEKTLAPFNSQYKISPNPSDVLSFRNIEDNYKDFNEKYSRFKTQFKNKQSNFEQGKVRQSGEKVKKLYNLMKDLEGSQITANILASLITREREITKSGLITINARDFLDYYILKN